MKWVTSLYSVHTLALTQYPAAQHSGQDPSSRYPCFHKGMMYAMLSLLETVLALPLRH